MPPRKIAGNPIQINKAMFVVIRWGMPFLRLTIVPARTCRMRDASWRRFIDTPTCLSSALQYRYKSVGRFLRFGRIRRMRRCSSVQLALASQRYRSASGSYLLAESPPSPALSR